MRTANCAVYLLLGALPIQTELHKRQLSLLYNAMVTTNETIKNLTERQIAVNLDNTLSYYRRVQDTLDLYQLITVHRYLPTCFILVWGGVCTKSPPSRQETPRTTIQFHLQIYRWCIVSEKHKICRVFGIHLSMWTSNKWNNGDCRLPLIIGLLSLHWQWKAYY